MLSCVLGLLAPSILAASFASPLDWSADGRWLAHTIDKPDSPASPPDWLFLRNSAADAAPGGPSTHQVWVTRSDGTESVLIEESRWPLSAPTWGSDGRSLFYGRFVPEAGNADAEESSVRGRYEVVARTGLDPSQSRAIPLQHDLELDAERLASIVAASPAVSSDGRHLAVPKPGRAAGIWVVRLDQDQVVQGFDAARSPAWSPDGRRLSFVRETPGTPGEAGRSIVIWDRDRGTERRIDMDVALLDAPPCWSLDGQSLLAVAAPVVGQARPPQVDLVRVNPETGLVVRVMTLETFAPNDQFRANANRRSPLLSRIVGANRIKLELSFDRERDQALCLIDAGMGEQAFKWCNTRTQNTFKRFHPFDPTIRAGAPNLAPDGQSVAFRVEGRGGLGLPAVCDLTTEEVTLIAPDEDARVRWLSELAFRSIELIEQGIRIRGGDGSPSRATVLPIPGELAGDHPRLFRLKRLAKIAGGLLDQSPSPHSPSTLQSGALEEYAFFFDYLRGDYRAAESRLDRLQDEAESPEDRLRRLLLRAQVLMGQGEMDRARGIVDYVVGATAAERRSVEETPIGPVVSEVSNPDREWSRRLAQRLTEVARTLSKEGSGIDGEVDLLEPRLDGWEPDGHGEAPPPFDPDEEDLDVLVPDQFGAPIAPIPRARYAPFPPQEIEPGDEPGLRIIPLND